MLTSDLGTYIFWHIRTQGDGSVVLAIWERTFFGTDFGEVCGVTDGTANQKVKYNSFGETTEIVRDKTSDFFEYDEEGRLTSKTIEDKDMGTVKNRYTYDKRGNVTSIETGMATLGTCLFLHNKNRKNDSSN